MKTCLLAAWSDSLTFTMASALTFSGHPVEVWIADVERDQSPWSLSSRISALPGARVIADRAARPAAPFERLIVQSHVQLLRENDLLERLAPQARHLTLVSLGDRSRPWRLALRMQWREWRWLGRWTDKLDRIAYKDGFRRFDWLGLRHARRVIGFDAHSNFLRDDALFQAIHAPDWAVDAPRRYRANFLGSRDPAIRERILASVEPYFTGVAAAGDAMLWRAYTDAQPAALGPSDFLGALAESDFTLAPPGYSLVTHRPVEALLRGSIPVLNADELDLYDLSLVDGINCIAVSPGGWPDAMARIVAMSPVEVVAMRRNVAAMLDERVRYPALARAIGRRLGVAEASAA